MSIEWSSIENAPRDKAGREAILKRVLARAKAQVAAVDSGDPDALASPFDSQATAEEVAVEVAQEQQVHRQEQFRGMRYADQLSNVQSRVGEFADAWHKRDAEGRQEYGDDPPTFEESIARLRERLAEDPNMMDVVDEIAPGLRSELGQVQVRGRANYHDAVQATQHSLGDVLSRMPGTLAKTAAMNRGLLRAVVADDPEKAATAEMFIALRQEPEFIPASLEAHGYDRTIEIAEQSDEIEAQNRQPSPLESASLDEMRDFLDGHSDYVAEAEQTEAEQDAVSELFAKNEELTEPPPRGAGSKYREFFQQQES